MPKIQALIFLGFLLLFFAIPFFGKKDKTLSSINLPSFKTSSDSSSFVFK